MARSAFQCSVSVNSATAMKFSTGKHKIVKDRLKIFPLILKVAENLRETLFRSVEFIRGHLRRDVIIIFKRKF